MCKEVFHSEMDLQRYRLVLLTGSMLLNGLQYVGGALLDGVYNLAEGVTGITSASMIQKELH